SCLLPVAAGTIRPEAPMVPLGIARAVAARPVVFVLELDCDLGAGPLGSGVMRVGVIHHDVDGLVDSRQVLRAHPALLRLGRAEHDDAGTEAHLRVRDGVVGAGVGGSFHEPEGSREPVHGRLRVAVAQAGIDDGGCFERGGRHWILPFYIEGVIEEVAWASYVLPYRRQPVLSWKDFTA